MVCQKIKKRLFQRATDEAMMTARALLLKEIQAGTSSGTSVFLDRKPKTFGQHGFDVSNLKWGGDETYAEVLFELLAKSPTFLAVTGLRLRRGLLCVDDVRLNFQTLDRGRCYTIGIRNRNFHPMAADRPLVWNIQSVDLASGVATAAGLPGIPRQAVYIRADLVRLVSSQDVRRRGIRVEDLELISQRALDDAKAAIAGKPMPRVLASREWVFNSSFNYGFILRSRRPEVYSDGLYASPLLHRVRQLIYSRRPPQQVQSARYKYNSLRAFLCPSDRSDFLELFPEFAPVLQCMRGLSTISSTSSSTRLK